MIIDYFQLILVLIIAIFLFYLVCSLQNLLIVLVGKMGSGKTLAGTILSKEYEINNKNSQIYSNVKLKLNNFNYTPFMILPFEKLQNCLLFIDDYYALRTAEAFITVLVNLSRKKDISIIITIQYYTMLPKLIRTLVDKLGYCFYDKYSDILSIVFVPQETEGYLIEQQETFFCLKAVESYKQFYDTKQPVEWLLDDYIVREILKICKTRKDIDLNLQMFFKNSTKRDKAKKEANKLLLEQKNKLKKERIKKLN